MSTKKNTVLLFCGNNYFGILPEKSNNCSAKGVKFIYPPIQSRINISTLSSYFVSESNSIWTTKDGKAYAIGSNSRGKISPSLPEKLEKETEIIITESDGHKCKVISAASSLLFRLFLVSQSDGTNQLVYNYYKENDGKPLFVNIGDRKPIAIFTGYDNSAAIDSEGI